MEFANEVKCIIAADTCQVYEFGEDKNQEHAYRKDYFFARKLRMPGACRLFSSDTAQHFLFIPAADLEQDDHGQGDSQPKPRDTFLSGWNDDPSRQQRTKRAAKITTKLENRLCEPTAAAR